MVVHLIKDKDVGKEMFSEVIDLLHAVPGPIEFKFDPANLVDFVENKMLD